MTTPIKAIMATGFAQPRFTIKRGDTIPALFAQIVEPNGAVSLTGTTVTLRYWPKSCCSMPPASEVRTLPCTLANSRIGTVGVYWTPESTAIAGEYEMEFSVEYLNGARFTAPNDGTLELVILDHP